MICRLCPRNCGAERTADKAGGACAMPALPVAALCAAYLAVFFQTDFLRQVEIEPSLWTTRGNGFVLNFSVCLRYSSVEEPEDYSSYGLVEMLRDGVRGRKVMVVRSDSGSDVLSDGLRDAGAEVTDVAAYRLKKAGMGNGLLHMMLSIKRGHMDCMAFTSPMSAQSFFDDIRDFFGQEDADRYMRDNVMVAAIGRPTAMKLESLGRKPDIVPERTTFRDMLEAIKAEFE